mmetsp:Transcript_83801/g.260416  ORF Transcript_83801/g.260416 Transcript_83801/m.260416 type:complete len:377 (+) Transcript_83801:423-1553(+)
MIARKELVKLDVVVPLIDDHPSHLDAVLHFRLAMHGEAGPLNLQNALVDVDGVQPEGFGVRTLHHDTVDESALLSHRGAHELNDSVAQEGRASVLLCRGLELCAQVDAVPEVQGIQLELGPNGTLNGRAAVQTIAHRHAVVCHAPHESRVVPVLGEQRRLADLRHGLDDRNQGHIGQALLLLWGMAGEAPCQEEGLTHVLVRAAAKLAGASVDDRSNAVGEHRDLVLQDLSRLGEVPHGAEAKYALDCPPGPHGVEGGGQVALHALHDDLRAGLAEAESQQRAYLDDGLLQDNRLHGLGYLVEVQRPHAVPQPGEVSVLFLVLCMDILGADRCDPDSVAFPPSCRRLVLLLISHPYGRQRVSPDLVDPGNHPLDWL